HTSDDTRSTPVAPLTGDTSVTVGTVPPGVVRYSNAPISVAAPCGRATPSRSLGGTPGHCATLQPVSIAAVESTVKWKSVDDTNCGSTPMRLFDCVVAVPYTSAEVFPKAML